MTKATGEQKLSLAFKGKKNISEAMEDVVWVEFFEVLNLFSEKE